MVGIAPKLRRRNEVSPMRQRRVEVETIPGWGTFLAAVRRHETAIPLQYPSVSSSRRPSSNSIVDFTKESLHDRFALW
jgi:hypothetical protein